jgi:hypothetical protein
MGVGKGAGHLSRVVVQFLAEGLQAVVDAVRPSATTPRPPKWAAIRRDDLLHPQRGRYPSGHEPFTPPERRAVPPDNPVGSRAEQPPRGTRGTAR